MMSAPPPYPHAEQLRDHWWWRPGWRPGRRFYTWHLTFNDQPDVQRLVTDYQATLKHVPGLDFVPVDWLHLTIQGVGFTDAISHAALAKTTDAVRRQLSRTPPIEVSFGPVVLHPEAVVLPAVPPDPLVELRESIRAGIADALGTEAVEGPEHGFRPHISVAYNTESRDPPVILDALAAAARTRAAHATIPAISLIALHRDHRLYQWTDVAHLPITGHQPFATQATRSEDSLKGESHDV